MIPLSWIAIGKPFKLKQLEMRRSVLSWEVFFFESFGWCDTKRHMLQICNQCPKISFSNRSKHRVTHSPGVPGCCDKSQVEVVEKRCRLGPQFLTTKLSSVVALWITFLELMNCLFVLSQKISWISTY